MAMGPHDMTSADQVHSDHMMVSSLDMDMVVGNHDMCHDNHECYHCSNCDSYSHYGSSSQHEDGSWSCNES